MTLQRREFLGAAAAALAGAAPRRPPNILFFFPDQWRFDWTGFNPALAVRTPNLDRIARQGVRFSRAVTASPVCAPARACLAAGKEYDACRVPSNGYDYPLDQTTFYTLLRNAGYHVTGCGKFDLHKKTEDWGLDGKRLLKEWGFSDGVDNAGKHDAIRSGARQPKDPYMAYLHRRGLAAAHVADFKKRKEYADIFPTPLPEEAYCDNWLSNNGLQLLKEAPRDKAWFLQINFTGPHPPMDITAAMEKACRGRDFPQPHRSTQFTPATHVAIRQNYTAMIENIDRWVGVSLAEVDKRGETDNTLVVFSSDHGEMLGDHNLWGKSKPHQPSIGVPLLAAGPGVRKGVASDALVSVMDVAATCLDYAGLAALKDMDSRSLRPLLEGRARHHRDYLSSGLDGWRLVRDERYKLVRTSQAGQLELYDLEADPLEDNNIAARAGQQVERLRPLLPKAWA